jgi:hypothetical protein
VPQRGQQRVLPEDIRFDSTPATADLLAAGARRLGFEEASPLQAEHAMRGVLSRYTDLLTKATDPVARRILGDDAPPRQVPPAVSRNPLVPDPRANPAPATTDEEQRFYAIRERVVEAQASVARAERDENDARHAEVEEEQRIWLDPDVVAEVEDTDKLIRSLRKEAAAVRRDFEEGGLSAEDARALLDQNAREQAKVFRESKRFLEELTGLLREN